MVWVVSEHSSCAVMGMFSTAFRHLALMMFCMPHGQVGGFFFSSPSNQCVEQFYQQPRKLVETCQLSQIAAAWAYTSTLNSNVLKRNTIFRLS